MSGQPDYIVYTPLLIIGVVQLLAVKVPEDVNLFLFYGSAVGAALLLCGFAAIVFYSELARHVLGFTLVALVLGFAVYIVATLPPYIAP